MSDSTWFAVNWAALPRRLAFCGAVAVAMLCGFPGSSRAFFGLGPKVDAEPTVSSMGATSAPAESASRRLVLIGVQTGVIHVDIPHPEVPGESFGTRFRLGMQLAYEVSRLVAVDGELGFSFLGESDSLNATLVSQGRAEGAAYTVVDASLGVLARWPLGGGRWAPFARVSGGIASLALSSPDVGTRRTDPLWSVGGGMEVGVARLVLLRLQGRWMGQATEGTTLHHAAAELAVFYALHSRSFAEEPAPGQPR